MAYTFFNKDKPDPTVDDGTDAATNIKANQQAIRDCIIVGSFFEWDVSFRNSTDTGPPTDYSKPPIIKYTKGTEIIKSTLTWSTNDLVNQIVYQYSSDSGTSYTVIKTKTITYNASGYVTAINWS